jgi:hypothetical protein
VTPLNIDFFSVSAKEVAETLDRDGFVCIENAISNEWLRQTKGYVERMVDQNGEKFFSIVRPSQDSGSPIRELVTNPAVTSLLQDVANCTGLANSPDDEGKIYNVLRVIAGPNGDMGSLNFHYDASTVTMLVPIFMPLRGLGRSGELVVFPNKRPFRRSLVFNLLEKALVQNRLSRSRSAKLLSGNKDELIRILYPGNLYLFWGYRGYHGNLPCAANSLRATLLLHYGNPHGKSRSLAAIRGCRRMVEALRRKIA